MRRTSNWKSPGLDGVPWFWFTKRNLNGNLEFQNRGWNNYQRCVWDNFKSSWEMEEETRYNYCNVMFAKGSPIWWCLYFEKKLWHFKGRFQMSRKISKGEGKRIIITIIAIRTTIQISVAFRRGSVTFERYGRPKKCAQKSFSYILPISIFYVKTK